MAFRKHRSLSEDFRSNFMIFGFILAFSFLLIRLFKVQVMDHQKYVAMAQDQYWNFNDIPAKRGEILSSDGYVLAGTQDHFLMFGEPKLIKDPYQVSNDLADILTSIRYKPQEGKDESKVKKQIHEQIFKEIYDELSLDMMWVPLQKDMTPQERDAIFNKKIPGIGFDQFPTRYYPEGTLASHILGFVASNDKGDKTGYYGIEGSLNDDLKGKPGRIMQETDATGLPILMGSFKQIDPSQGRNVVLTINRAVQYIVEKKIKEGVEGYDAKSGTVIIMNPYTGDVIAMANYPTYSPADFSAEDTSTDEPHRKKIERKNLAISETYEPGSVIKPFTVSSAVDLKLVKPETTWEDSGPVWYSGYKVDTWDGKHYGTQTIIQLLQKSNNIGASWVGEQVGRENLYKYLTNFGMGSKTGIDLEGEETGTLAPAKEWADIALANISFGQGISATPLQVLTGFNAIINGGYLMKPRIIEKMENADGITEIPIKTVRKVITKETSDLMIPMLEKTVEGGESRYFNLKDYKIAGKTGTAQIPEEGRYAADRTNATFIGFMSGSKQFSMIVKLQEPKTSIYAAETAVPLWMGIAKELTKFYGLPPDNIASSSSPSSL